MASRRLCIGKPDSIWAEFSDRLRAGNCCWTLGGVTNAGHDPAAGDGSSVDLDDTCADLPNCCVAGGNCVTEVEDVVVGGRSWAFSAKPGICMSEDAGGTANGDAFENPSDCSHTSFRASVKGDDPVVPACPAGVVVEAPLTCTPSFE